MVQAKNEGYLGNTQIKRVGIETKYTEEELAEYMKCSKDPCHFIEQYTQIISLDEGMVPFKLRGYQDKLIQHYDSNRFSVVLASIVVLIVPPRSNCSCTCKQRCDCERNDSTYRNYVRVCSIFLTARRKDFKQR